ncbi:MAG TPA: hypothetical protein EYG11_25255 [Candidatus Latescibacteria bacterium]|nr:hypothetical protein [Candidatus Latescibacterota bacterium]
MTAFIAHMRAKFKTPEMPFVIARVLNFYGGETGQAKIVRNAQVKIAESTANVTWFETDTLERENHGHYHSKGLVTIGHRFATGYAEITGGAAYNEK